MSVVEGVGILGGIHSSSIDEESDSTRCFFTLTCAFFVDTVSEDATDRQLPIPNASILANFNLLKFKRRPCYIVFNYE